MVPKRLMTGSRAAAALPGASLRLGVRSPRRRAVKSRAIDVHMVGEAFALIERDTLTAVELRALGSANVRASMRNLSGTISVSAPVAVRESLRR